MAEERYKEIRRGSIRDRLAFVAKDSVLYGSERIGMLPARFLPPRDDHFLLGGRRWQVVSVDDDRKEVAVQPAHGKKPPKFFGSGSEIHPKVRQGMRDVILGDQQFGYLNATAGRLLRDARVTALQSGLARNSLISLSPIRCLWLTWTGTKIQRTLCLIADSVGLRPADRGIGIEFESGVSETVEKLDRARRQPIDSIALAAQLPMKRTRKFDHLIADPLLIRSLAHDALDVTGAEAILQAFETA